MVETKFQSPTQRSTAKKRFSPRKDDSPSRQLDFELGKALEQLHLHDYERRKVHAYNRRSYHEELDAKDLALAKAHMEALDAASAKHEAVRQEAEAVLQRHLKEQEERRRREQEEEAERQRREREAKEKAESERKAREEAERKARLEKERREAEAKRVAEEKAQAEAAEVERKKREEKEAAAAAAAAEQKERVERESAAKAQAEKETLERQKAEAIKTAAKAPVTKAASRPGFFAASSEAEAIHSEYLALHDRLKKFRKNFWESAKQNKPLKAAVGDMRRAMKMSVSQLTDDKVGNKKASERVKTAILQALREVSSPEVAISDFLPQHLSLNDQGATKIPSLIVYLLSIFSKAVISTFANECAVNTRAAEPIGTLTAQVFSLTELQFTRQTASSRDSSASLIPILLAKFHKVAPILFGISGREDTAAGRVRLGWRAEPSSEPDSKTFVSEQRHHERMTGLGAGFSSIALRNFSKTKLRNPFPPTHFWASLAGIVNTPPEEVQTSHLILLKSMLENNASDRFVLFFGNMAVAALREAIVEFPKKLPSNMKSNPAARNVTQMLDAFEKDKHFRLS